MFTKEEKRDLVRRFWSQFDVFCLSVPELAGRKKKWILHDTKISHLDLKFDVGRDFAMVALEINHRNDELRFKIFELIERYRPMLESEFPAGLIWDFCYIRDNGQEVCRIYREITGVDFHKLSDWLQIYTFFAENMLKLQDNFLQIQEYLADEILALLRKE
jgi:hypothetical protein